MTQPLLEVRNLRTYFHSSRALYRSVDGIDLTIEPGRTLCVVGESGSGKSVTALSIMGLIEAPGEIQPGSEILFEGRNLVTLPERARRAIRGRDFSMIFQEPMTSLDPVYNVGDQIAEAVRAHQQMSRGQARARTLELMALVGIPSPERRVTDYPHQMSGGMRQRIMIAMALTSDPKLLIADEPTTALDVTIQAQILDLLRDLRDRVGMAILLITHDVGIVAEMADDVVVMYAGKVVERGRVADVLERPQHPYTEALLRAVPRLGMDRSRPLEVIPGVVPGSEAWPQGCRFAARCPYVHDRCLAESPPLLRAGPQESACWLRLPAPQPERSTQGVAL